MLTLSEILISRPSCSQCKNNMFYSNAIPQRHKNAMLNSGDYYCDAGKKIVKFKKREVGNTVPTWCPIRKNPAILRIYSYVDSGFNIFINSLLNDSGSPTSPSEQDYIMRYEGTTNIFAIDFIQYTAEEPLEDLLGTKVLGNDVIEIDDGLVPYCFHILPGGTFVKAISFNGEKVRNNKFNAQVILP